MASIAPMHVASSSADWQDLYHRFSADARNQMLPPGMAKLEHWPDLAIVPDEFVGTITRICALLWRKPTAGHLIAHILGEARPHVNLLIQALYAFGYIEFIHQDDAAQIKMPAKASPAPTIKTDNRMSFIDKLRQQLLGRYFFDDTPIV